MKHTFTVIVAMIMGLTAVSAVAQQATNTETLQVQNGNEIRLYELGTNGSNYTSFKAAGSLSGEIKYTLPAALPTTNQVLSATAVSGTDVTLGWANDATGSGGSSYALHDFRTTDVTNSDNATWTTVLTVTPSTSTNYAFICTIRFKTTADASDPDFRFTVPTGTTINYAYYADNPGNNNGAEIAGNVTDGTTTQTPNVTNTNWNLVQLSGTANVSTTSGNIVLQFKRNSGTGTLTAGIASSILFFPKQ